MAIAKRKPAETKPKQAGRPSKYEEKKKKALLLAGKGFTNYELALLLDIAVSTVHEWRKNFPEFSDILKKGRDAEDEKVVNSLNKRAHGYEYVETTEEYVAWTDDEGKEGERLKSRKTVTKQMAPDTTAQIFWLINRQHEDWKKNGKDPIDNNNGIDTVDFKFNIVGKKDGSKSKD